jgi:hypothetical protein
MVSRFSSSGVGPIGLEKLLIHGRERYNFQIEEGTHTWGATRMNHWKLGYKVELSIKLPILYRGKCHGYVGTTATAFHDLLHSLSLLACVKWGYPNSMTTIPSLKR